MCYLETGFLYALILLPLRTIAPSPAIGNIPVPGSDRYIDPPGAWVRIGKRVGALGHPFGVDRGVTRQLGGGDLSGQRTAEHQLSNICPFLAGT